MIPSLPVPVSYNNLETAYACSSIAQGDHISFLIRALAKPPNIFLSVLTGIHY